MSRNSLSPASSPRGVAVKEDPGIQWIRDIRSRISRELHNNPGEVVAFHQSLRPKYQRESEEVSNVRANNL